MHAPRSRTSAEELGAAPPAPPAHRDVTVYNGTFRAAHDRTRGLFLPSYIREGSGSRTIDYV